MKIGSGIAIAGIWIGAALACFAIKNEEVSCLIFAGATVATCFIAFMED